MLKYSVWNNFMLYGLSIALKAISVNLCISNWRSGKIELEERLTSVLNVWF